MGLHWRGIIIGKIFASEIWGGLFSGGLFFFEGGGRLLSEFYGYLPLDIQRKYSELIKLAATNFQDSLGQKSARSP